MFRVGVFVDGLLESDAAAAVGEWSLGVPAALLSVHRFRRFFGWRAFKADCIPVSNFAGVGNFGDAGIRGVLERGDIARSHHPRAPACPPQPCHRA